MRRFLLVAALVLPATYCRPASAQSFGNSNQQDPLAEIESARTKAKSYKYAQAQRNWARSDMADRFGRVDMSGHSVAGYPRVRGDIGTARSYAGKTYGRTRRYRSR